MILPSLSLLIHFMFIINNNVGSDSKSHVENTTQQHSPLLFRRRRTSPLNRLLCSRHQKYEIMYHPVHLEYYLNPNDVARRIARVIANFEGIQNVEKMNLNSQFW
jgi:glucuronate isomerase